MRRMEPVVAADGALSQYRCTECAWSAPVLSVGSIDSLAKSRDLVERSFARHVCADYKQHSERRRSVRHAGGGRAELRTAAATIDAEPVQVARSGMTVRSDALLPPGTLVRLLFTLAGHPGAIAIEASVVHCGGNIMGLRFLEFPPELERLIRDLEAK